MKKGTELDVDFIGGEKKPTEEEFLAISAFIKAQKAKPKRKLQSKITGRKIKVKQPS